MIRAAPAIVLFLASVANAQKSELRTGAVPCKCTSYGDDVEVTHEFLNAVSKDPGVTMCAEEKGDYSTVCHGLHPEYGMREGIEACREDQVECTYVKACGVPPKPPVPEAKQADAGPTWPHFARMTNNQATEVPTYFRYPSAVMEVLARHMWMGYNAMADSKFDARDDCATVRQYVETTTSATGVRMIGGFCNNLENPAYNTRVFIDQEPAGNGDPNCPGPSCHPKPVDVPKCENPGSLEDAFGAQAVNTWSLAWGQFFAHGWAKHHKDLDKDGKCKKTITQVNNGKLIEVCAISNKTIDLNSPYLDQGQTYGDHKEIAAWMYKHVYRAARQRVLGPSPSIHMWMTGVQNYGYDEEYLGLQMKKRLGDINSVISAFFSPEIIENENLHCELGRLCYAPRLWEDGYGIIVDFAGSPAFLGEIVQEGTATHSECQVNGHSEPLPLSALSKYLSIGGRPTKWAKVATEADCQRAAWKAAFDAHGDRLTVGQAMGYTYHMVEVEEHKSWTKLCEIFSDQEPDTLKEGTLVDELDERTYRTFILGTNCFGGPSSDRMMDHLYVLDREEDFVGDHYLVTRKLLYAGNAGLIDDAPARTKLHMIDDHFQICDMVGGDNRKCSNKLLELVHDAWEVEHTVQAEAIAKAYVYTQPDWGPPVEGFKGDVDDYYLVVAWNWLVEQSARAIATAEYQVFAVDKFGAAYDPNTRVTIVATNDAQTDPRTTEAFSILFRLHAMYPRKLQPSGQSVDTIVGMLECKTYWATAPHPVVYESEEEACRDLIAEALYTPATHLSQRMDLLPLRGSHDTLQEVNRLRTSELGWPVHDDDELYIYDLDGCPGGADSLEHYSRQESSNSVAQTIGGSALTGELKDQFRDFMFRLQQSDRFYYVHQFWGTDIFAQLEGQTDIKFLERYLRYRNTKPTWNSMNSQMHTSKIPDFTLEDYEGLIVKDCNFPLVQDGKAKCAADIVDADFLHLSHRQESHLATEDHFTYQCLVGGGNVIAGRGDDSVDVRSGPAFIYGYEAGEDVLTGAWDDYIVTGYGEKAVVTSDGNDVVEMLTHSGPVLTLTEGGDDLVLAVDAAIGTEAFLGAGNDVLALGHVMEAFGGDGDDWLQFSSGSSGALGDNGWHGIHAHCSTSCDDVHYATNGLSGTDLEGGDDIFLRGDMSQQHRARAQFGHDCAIAPYGGEFGPYPVMFDLTNQVFRTDHINVKASLARLQEFECASGSRQDDIIKARGTEFIGCLGEPLHPALSVLNLDSYVGGHNCIEISRAGHAVEGDGVYFKFEFMTHMSIVLKKAVDAGAESVLPIGEFTDFIAASLWPSPDDPAVEALPYPIRPAPQSMLDASFVLGGKGEDFMILTEPGLYFVDGSSWFDAHLKVEGDDTPYYDARELAIKHAKRHGKDVQIHRTFHAVEPGSYEDECDAMVIEMGPGEALFDLSGASSEDSEPLEDSGIPKIPVTFKSDLAAITASQEGGDPPPIFMAVAHANVDCHFAYAVDLTEGFPLDLNGYSQMVVNSMLMPWSKQCCKNPKNKKRFVQQFEIAFKQELLPAPAEVAGVPVPAIEVAEAALVAFQEEAAAELFRAQAAAAVAAAARAALRAITASQFPIAQRFASSLSRLVSGANLNGFIDLLAPELRLGLALSEEYIQAVAEGPQTPALDIGLAQLISSVGRDDQLDLANAVNRAAADFGVIEDEEGRLR